MNDQLWGGGELIAPSPEATSPIPPDQEEIDRFIKQAREHLAAKQLATQTSQCIGQLTLKLDQ